MIGNWKKETQKFEDQAQVKKEMSDENGLSIAIL